MHTESSILINAPLESVFEMTSNLSRWPELLSHYRWIRWIEGGPDSGIVEMAAMRSALPIKWVSEFRRDRLNQLLWFRHISAFTKGMEVIWNFKEGPDGVRVNITHKLLYRWPLLSPFAEPIIGGFMIGWVAPRTLSGFKNHLEKGN